MRCLQQFWTLLSSGSMVSGSWDPGTAKSQRSLFDCIISSSQAALENDQLAAKKLADVADQSAQTLIEGLDEDEQNFDYSLYNGSPYDKGNWVSTTGGFVCPSKVIYGRPMRAVNAEGQWRVIVQYVNNVTQTQRIETCLVNGGSCRTLVPCHQSRCLQKYSYQRFLSFDPCNPRRGLFVDIYKLPSACSCHIGKWLNLEIFEYFKRNFHLYKMEI